jgi:hypothetical protein
MPTMPQRRRMLQEGRGFAIEFLNLAEETRQRLEHLLLKALTPV